MEPDDTNDNNNASIKDQEQENHKESVLEWLGEQLRQFYLKML